ncbi:MAG TPA: FtsX-like permease family protein, partial [Pilimelia sp.]|nr:FtsX-like permease family protein [Pilimelia sp.]
VLVLAVATGVFCGAVTTSVADARDRAAERAIPADRMVRGGYVTAGTTARFAAVPGVTRVAPMAVEAGTTVRAGGASTGRVQVVVVDGAALADVGRRSRTGVHLPAVVAQARRAGPVRAVLSPDVAADLRLATGGAGEALVRGRPYDFTAGAVVADFPGGAGRFVVLPWQALAPDDAEWVLPNTFLIAGRADPAALRAVALAGEREAGRGAAAVPPTVLTREAYRQGLDRTGANDVLSVAYGVGALGGTALALLTVAFLVLGGAPGRARSLSRLRTMGLSPRQGRALLAYEVAPLLLLAVLVGGVVGVLLPMALGPALGLSLFTAGVPARVRVDPWLVAAVLGLVAVAVLVALAVENLANRRLRLGAVLRVGEG